MSDNFYTSPRWRRLRTKALQLYGEECMNCGSMTKPPHVDHIKPRSRFPHLELKLGNLQILCERCNCELKGTEIVDYRTHQHTKILERFEGGKHVLSPIITEKIKLTKFEKDYACKRAIYAIKELGPKKQKKRLEHIVKQFGKERTKRIVSQAI